MQKEHPQYSERWHTKDEVLFVKSLRKKKPQLWLNYKNSLHMRTDWGRINKQELLVAL